MADMFPKLYVDGDFGKKTIIALQMYLKHKAKTYTGLSDGVFGHYTALGMQYWLRNNGYYDAPLKIDGNAGQYTWSALNDMLWTKFNIERSILPGYDWIQVPGCRSLQDFLNARRAY